MSMKPTLLLSCALLLAACGQAPAPAAQTAPATAPAASVSAAPSAESSLQTLSVKADALSVNVPQGAAHVTFTLQGAALPQGKVFPAVIRGGQASVNLSGLPKGDPKYTVTVRTYDAEGGAVLYTAQTSINLSSGKVTAPLTFGRVTADVTVVVEGVLPETTGLVAQLGDRTQTLTVKDGVATGTFTGVPTGAGQTVTVTGKAADGRETQTGSQTFRHAEGGSRVNVPLTAVSSCPAPAGTLTAIPAVQGSGDASPLLGQTVTVRGVVTADFQTGLRGFFVQDAQGDGNAATSDGVFVYTGTAPQQVQVGDLVQLSGSVAEFYGSTQLSGISAFVSCGRGQAPQPVPVQAPFADLERYEGMAVTFPDTLTVTNNYGYGRYGELGLSSGGRLFNPTNGNEATTPEQNAARTITLDDGNSAQNPAELPYLSAEGTRRTGDTVQGLTGVLHYANNAFKVEPTAAPNFVNANPRPVAPQDVGGTLKVAGANVLNYFTTFGPNDRGADSAYEFGRQQAKVVAALRGLDADVVTLMEVQNNGDVALNDLVASLNAAYGSETYRAVQTGTIGTDAIKVAVIYKPARVTPLGTYQTDTDPVHSRPPLAQTFRDNAGGGVFTVVANHFKSKGSCPSSGDMDTGEGCWNELRVQQARALLGFVERLKAQSGDSDVLLMGDFNAYGAEKPIQTIVDGGFVSENLRIPAEERYSYQFGGQFGYLDHALASRSLDAQVSGVTEWHINADEPTLADYNVEYKANPECRTNVCTSPDLWQNNPFRASDHDPVLVGLNLTRDEARLTLNVTGEPAVTAGQPYTLNIAAGAPLSRLTVDWGDQSGAETLDPAAVSAAHTFAAAGNYPVTVTATGVDGQTQTARLNVTVGAPDVTDPAPQPAGAGLVISQVYGGGGNSGATYTHDFIEIFNAGRASVNLGGYSVQYASATGTSWAVTPLNSYDLAPGQYYLVQQAKGSGGTQPLPTPDASGILAMSGSAGQVALVQGTAKIAASSDAGVVDYVPFSGLSNTTSARRLNGGCTDTGSYGADFQAGTVSPRNTASPLNVCP
ncbi:Endonuclease/exonuclease/phosphatase [Deinococcus proteolyticus MRP]|uniref:Endonuclease/exonuclease/phosphatase n=1 Tax=Deinococcus proteolyticus (strain ATCC 35074 / DSM 20540 / JCM 6276 / NBRC 101906 / NCIMB 13154 / VKM Ac-1939 / CCM 2703 / MRP) TaxID=693977 RepID=F0RL87_DEIPM|nr:ExeM/NucH family extracellular endonuclease [Deinococcus proteolyticus]ADY26879.1 Endonuclease/exonuclease/phosphatase [Deinococcus proteolyticus MRP]